MALVNIREVYPGVSLGLWQIDETLEKFYEYNPMLREYSSFIEDKYKHDGRKLEFLAIRALLYEMLKIRGISDERIKEIGEISHDSVGKPLLKGFHISISHTQGYAALIISRNQEVAVDIEYFSDRVERVAFKFMRRDENAQGLDELLVHWCAKETMYKLFSKDNLQYSQMRVKPFDTMSDWACEVENLKSRKTVRIDFELTMDFVLTYAALL